MGIIISGNTISNNFNTSGEITNTPEVVTNGLVLWLDAGNNFSYINSPNYYDCGYGPQYYSSDPGCPACNTRIMDLSGYGNDGLLNGNAGVTYGTYGGVMTFDGSGDYVNCGNFGSFYTTGTISFWVNASVMANYNNAFTTKHLGTNVGIRFEENAIGNFDVIYGNDGGTYDGATFLSNSMQINTWYHIGFVWNTSANNVIGYLNGVQVFNKSNTYWATTMPAITIGGGFDSSRYWNGKIGPFMIYNRVLSGNEILQNFNNGRQRFGI